VITLREHPGVAARHRAELDDGPPPEVPARVNMSDVSLERDAVAPPARQAERARREAVDSVGPEHHRRPGGRTVEADGRAGLVDVERRGLHAVAEVGARRGGLLGQVRVEAPALRHEHERPLALALEAPPVAEAELAATHGVLHDRLDGDSER
jgi:hypothetical protein